MKNNCDENGNCICVQCGTIIPHIKCHPCREEKCPKCGRHMLRENGYHHQLYLQKMADKQANDKNSNIN